MRLANRLSSSYTQPVIDDFTPFYDETLTAYSPCKFLCIYHAAWYSRRRREPPTVETSEHFVRNKKNIPILTCLSMSGELRMYGDPMLAELPKLVLVIINK